MSSSFIAQYGRFSASMKPVSVKDVSKLLLPFITNDIITLPKESSLDVLFPNKIKGTKFLQIRLANGRKINILNDDYRFDIKVNLLSNEKPFCIVYAVFINPNSNWRAIISGQLADIKKYGLLDEAELYIHIIDVNHTKGMLQLVRKKAGVHAVITQSFTNQFEYPGIKLLYDCAAQHPHKTYLYFHTKGMSHDIKNEYGRKGRSWLVHLKTGEKT